MLLLKLLLVPAFVAAVSLIGRRWGPGVAGWIAGMPLVTGPILFFLALERDAAFTAAAAIASMSAVLAAVLYGAAYAWASLRTGWPGAAACASAAWLATVLLLAQLPPLLPAALAVSIAALVSAPRLFPRPGAASAPPPGGRALPGTELALRMLAGAALVLSVTAAAEAMGAGWTGLLAMFPVISTILAVFSHRAYGPGFVISLLRGMAMGFYALTAFCLAVALLLERTGVAATFAVAVAAAAGVQWGARRWILRGASG